MDKKLHHNIFKPSDCLGREELLAYLGGKISPVGRHRVENHLLDCPLCSDAVEGFHETGPQSIHSLAGFDSFRKMLPAEEGARVRPLIPARVFSGVAALAAALIIGGVMYFNWFLPADNDTLYNRFYSTYQNDIPLNLRSAEDVQPLHPALKNALENYSTGNFAASLPLFEDALKAEPGNDAAHFFAGMACLESGQLEKAADYFENARQSSGSYASKATWYMALCHLKLNNGEKAKSLLKELAESGGFNGPESKKLLENL